MEQVSFLQHPLNWNGTYQILMGMILAETKAGTCSRDRVAVKRKIKCTWLPMDGANMSKLLSAVTDPFFELTYPDALDGKNRTITCYVGDRSAPIMRPNNDGVWLWGQISMNFIER